MKHVAKKGGSGKVVIFIDDRSVNTAFILKILETTKNQLKLCHVYQIFVFFFYIVFRPKDGPRGPKHVA